MPAIFTEWTCPVVLRSRQIAREPTATTTATITNTSQYHRAREPSAVRLLEVFGMVEMSDKRGPYFHEQRFQFSVLRVRNQNRVQGRDDLFMVGDFVVDVRFVEGLSAERA